MDTLEQPRSKRRRIVAIILGVGGAGALLCCGCGGCFVYDIGRHELPAARAAANAFYDDLQAGRITDAYASTATALKESASEEQFRKLLASDVAAAQRGHTHRTMSKGRVYAELSGVKFEFRVAVRGPGGTGTSTVLMINEGGTWKVARAFFSQTSGTTKPN